MKTPEDMTPQEINAEISNLRTQREQISGRLHALRLRLALDACPYQVGEVLVNRTGERGRIDEIGIPGNLDGQAFSLSGVYLKKDGTVAMNPGRDNLKPRFNPFYSWEEWKRPDA